MRPKAKLKTPAAGYPIPDNREAADAMIYMIGEAQRGRATLQTELDGKIAELKAEYEERAAKLNVLIRDYVAGLQHWCASNRAVLLKGDAKTVKFGNGEVSWRTRPPKVTVRDAVKAIAWYAKKELGRFVRIKEELDKEAILRVPAIAGQNPFIKIGSAGEDFIVKPHELELEEIA